MTKTFSLDSTVAVIRFGKKGSQHPFLPRVDNQKSQLILKTNEFFMDLWYILFFIWFVRYSETSQKSVAADGLLAAKF
jgi:hypothetical protein